MPNTRKSIKRAYRSRYFGVMLEGPRDNPFADAPTADANTMGEECLACTEHRTCDHPYCCHGGHGRHKELT